MLYTTLISYVLLLIAVLLSGLRVFFMKGGQFPNIQELRGYGVNCVITQGSLKHNKRQNGCIRPT